MTAPRCAGSVAEDYGVRPLMRRAPEMQVEFTRFAVQFVERGPRLGFYSRAAEHECIFKA
jgi:hypothetical protein